MQRKRRYLQKRLNGTIIGDNENQTIEPIIKWAGGKRQLLYKLREYIPNSFNDYYEPFFGGGALFFYLYSQGKIKKAHINDINRELMIMYKVVKEKVEELIDELNNTKRYINKRNQYNYIRDKLYPSLSSEVEKAAVFLYLNHTCYNGLYRVNKSGRFNVPYGGYTRTKIFGNRQFGLTERYILLLRKVSKALRNVEITCDSFEIATKKCKKEDFIYFDPPYLPNESSTAFTSYTRLGFGLDDHKKLFSEVTRLNDVGAYILLSNSDAEVIREMYNDIGFNIDTVSARRSINCDPNGRGLVNELIIYNYTI